MDFLTFLSNLSTAAMWPAVVIIIFILVRKELPVLFQHLTKFEAPGGLKGEFSKQLDVVKKEADAANVPKAPPELVINVPPSGAEKEWLNLVERAPVLAIQKLSSDLENRLLAHFGQSKSATKPRFELMAKHPELLEIYQSLAKLSSQAIHGDQKVTSTDARTFEVLVKRLNALLDQVEKQQSA